MFENKKKYAYWMRPSMVDEIEEMLPYADADSKSEFVSKAVDFYIGYLRQQRNIDYLAPVISDTIKNEIESVERHLSEMLFKVAVEQAINSNIVAAEFNVDPEVIERLRSSCSRSIAKTNGILTFDKAYEWQKGEQ